MRRRLAAVAVLVAVLAVAYFLFGRNKTIAPTLTPAQPTAMIGAGSSAVGVGPDGAVLAWLPSPEEGSLPQLPLSKPPKGGQLQGPMLQQARVLGAAPAVLRPYVEGSYYGESGVDVKLKAGIELRFGDASQAARKWRAAAAVLASPSTTTLDYVDLSAPGRPDIGGSGHALPSLP